MVAGSHPWSDSLWGIGSGAMVGAVVTGGSLAVGGCSPSDAGCPFGAVG